MSFLQFAARMLPFWTLGALSFYTVWKSSHKELLAFNKVGYFKFISMMLYVSIFRFIILSAAMKNGAAKVHFSAVNSIPIGATLFVFWEDMCHTVPLALLGRLLGPNKRWYPVRLLATMIVMLSFALGHLYQGIVSAALISLYIPVTMYYGKKVGYGTVMACHTSYDFLTILTIKIALLFS